MFGSKCTARLLGAALSLSACGAPPPPAPSSPSAVVVPTPARANAETTTTTPSPSAEAEWLAEPKPDLRRLTVVIRALPPPALVSRYERLAVRFRPLEPLFKGAAEGGFGSGFVVVRSPARVFLVTNRHVVGLATDVLVTLEGEASARPARVVYVDDRYDLVVLSFEPGAEVPLKRGFALASEPAHDQDAVVASGYPGIGDRPSYQVTRGFVSNERFSLEEDGGETYVQHTAPIDPGSSGGPLTTPEGKLLGVNTLKIRGRENVGLAVPASVVKGALEQVLKDADAVARTPDEQALVACEAMLARVAAGEQGLAALERSLGAPLVAELGVASLPVLPPPNEKWIAGFIEDPTTVFLRAIALRLGRGAAGTSCARSGGDATSVSFKAKLAGAERLLTFAPEQGRWKLTKAELGASRGRSFLDGAQPVTPKKWKPSLR